MAETTRRYKVAVQGNRVLIFWSLGLLLACVAEPVRAQYIQLWNITSTGGPDAQTFDLGDETNDLLFPMTQHGSQGDWPGGTAYSGRALARPGVGGVHGNLILPYQAHTVYGDTDSDGAMEFVSDNVLLGQIVVWDGATATVEARIPYPPGATQLMYIILVDVNASNGVGSCEIIAHWLAGLAGYGTTCWGRVGGAEAPETPQLGVSSMKQNRPNPFGPQTEIQYSLVESGEATLNVYDVEGRLVRTLQEGRQEAGDHTVAWDRRNDGGATVAAGVYFYELSSGGKKFQRKAVVLD
jgi:hypothetical protein